MVESRHGWRWAAQGAVVGALVAGLVFTGINLVRSDVPDPVLAGYRLVGYPEVGTHELSLLRVWDVRQPSSFPGLVAPTGDRYVTLVGALEHGENESDGWLDLDGLQITLHAVDGSGDREELVPTARGRRTLEGVGGTVQATDPYWFRIFYEPPSMRVDHYEVDLHIDGEDHTFAVTEDEQ